MRDETVTTRRTEEAEARDVIGRAWRCEACHRLWVEQKHPGAAHDHVDGIVVCRGRVIEVEVVPYPDHQGAVRVLREIASVDAVDAALDPERVLRIARAWLREHDATGER